MMGKKMKTRKWSIRTKIILAATLVILCVVVFLGLGVYYRTKNDMIKMGMEQAEVCANVAAYELDGAVLAKIHEGDMNSDEYQEYLEELRGVKKTCNVKYIYTLYTDGKNVYYGIDTDESGAQAKMGSEYVESYEDMASVFAGEEYVQDYIDSSDGDNVITVYMPIYDGNKVVAVLGSDFDADNIVERMAGFRNRVIQIGLIGLILGLIVIVLLVNQILKRIYVVNQKLQELASNEGDLTQRIELHSGDETELIADNINTLLGYIRDIMLDISKGSVDLNDSVQKVVRDMANSRGSVEDVSATMEQMSAGLEQTSASLNRINESVEDMYANVREMYESAEQSNQFTKDIQEKAVGIFRKARAEQQSAYEQSGKIAALVKEKIKESQSVEEIHLLTENILEITSQTNLLALNASIEAARAGEAGRGFAVVAGEIGNLASNSAEAASKIQQVSNQVITAVQGLADEADRLIKFVNETAMAGYQDLLTTSEDYRKDAEEIHNVMNGFANAATDLEHTADNIKEMVESVDVSVDENVKGIVNVTETVTDLTDMIVDIEKQTEHNRAISDSFQVEVGKFKLS